jgi:hypothetical protein
MRELKQSTAANVMVFLVGSADHITGLASATLTITASKDGAAFASISPTVTDLGSGWYNLALTTTHTNTLGDLALHITAASADPIDTLSRVIAMDKNDTVRLGITALPNAAAEAAGGLYTRGSGAGQINQPANGMVDTNIVRSLGTALAAPTVAGIPKVEVSDYVAGKVPLQPTVAGRTLDVSAGGEGGIDWANIGSPTTTVNLSGTTIGVLTALAAGAITATAIASNAITAAKIAADAIGASQLAADAVDEIWDEVYEGAETIRQMLRGVRSLLVGKGLDLLTNPRFRDAADSKNRVTFTMGGSGDTRTPTVDLT